MKVEALVPMLALMRAISLAIVTDDASVLSLRKRDLDLTVHSMMVLMNIGASALYLLKGRELETAMEDG